MEPVNIELQNPIVRRTFFGREKTVQMVTLREPKVRDLFGLDWSASENAQSMSILIARISGIDSDTIAEMSLADYTRIAEMLNQFFVVRAMRQS